MVDSYLLLSPGGEGKEQARPVQDTQSWRILHAGAFLLGGTTFCAGTAVLFPPPTPLLASISAALYTLGSLGFLAVDVMEFVTFTSPCLLRSNIALSALGSACYVAGSVGFFPAVYSATAVVGVWGFIVGSALIGVSQLCKIWRIAHFAAQEQVAGDAASASGVEGGAAAGAWLFFAGTLLLLLNGDYFSVLVTWMAGSLAFTLGGVSLALRHFVLRIT